MFTAKFVKQTNLTLKKGHKIRKTILVTGTPGVGKTSTAQKLASKLEAQYVNITELVKADNLTIGADEKRDTLVADTEKVAQKLQETISDSNQTVIVDGHYAVDVVPKQDVTRVFVLRRDPRELKETLQKRGYSKDKVNENLASEILDVCLVDAMFLCGVNKVCEIDVSCKTVEQVVDEILRVINKKQNCKVGIVDWLGTLEKEGQLENYMKEIDLSKQP